MEDRAEELETLQAIFGEDVIIESEVDPARFSILIKQEFCCVALDVSYTEEYPNEAPNVSISNRPAPGRAAGTETSLTRDLIDEATKHLRDEVLPEWTGMPCVSAVVQALNDWLVTNESKIRTAKLSTMSAKEADAVRRMVAEREAAAALAEPTSITTAVSAQRKLGEIPTTAETFAAWADRFYADLDECVAAGRVCRSLQGHIAEADAALRGIAQFVGSSKERDAAARDAAGLRAAAAEGVAAVAAESKPTSAAVGDAGRRLTGKEWFLRKAAQIDWSVFKGEEGDGVEEEGDFDFGDDDDDDDDECGDDGDAGEDAADTADADADAADASGDAASDEDGDGE